jgi:hypothetical protein
MEDVMADRPTYKCLTKATRGENANPRASFNWVVARRGWFKIFEDRVECGNWCIPLSEVQKATLFRFRYWFMKATVIQLDTADGHYQFGFNPWASPTDHMSLTFEEQEVKLDVPASIRLYRLAVLAAAGFWIWWSYFR